MGGGTQWTPAVSFPHCDFPPPMASTPISGVASAEDCHARSAAQAGAGNNDWFSTYDGSTQMCYYHDRAQVPTLSESQTNSSTDVETHTVGVGFTADVLNGGCGVRRNNAEYMKPICTDLWNQAQKALGPEQALRVMSAPPFGVCVNFVEPVLATSPAVRALANSNCHALGDTCITGTDHPWDLRCVSDDAEHNYSCGLMTVAWPCETNADCNPPGTPEGLGPFTCERLEDKEETTLCALSNSANTTTAIRRNRCEHPPKGAVSGSGSVAFPVPGQWVDWEKGTPAHCRCPTDANRRVFSTLIHNPRYAIDPANPTGPGAGVDVVSKDLACDSKARNCATGALADSAGPSECGDMPQSLFADYCQAIKFTDEEFSHVQDPALPVQSCTVVCPGGACYNTAVPFCSEQYSISSFCTKSVNKGGDDKEWDGAVYQCLHKPGAGGNLGVGVPCVDGSADHPCDESATKYNSMWELMAKEQGCAGHVSIQVNTATSGPDQYQCMYQDSTPLPYAPPICRCEDPTPCAEKGASSLCGPNTVAAIISTDGMCVSNGTEDCEISNTARGACAPYGLKEEASKAFHSNPCDHSAQCLGGKCSEETHTCVQGEVGAAAADARDCKSAYAPNKVCANYQPDCTQDGADCCPGMPSGQPEVCYNADLICQSGKCKTCGGENDPCCAGDHCLPGLGCNQGTCKKPASTGCTCSPYCDFLFCGFRENTSCGDGFHPRITKSCFGLDFNCTNIFGSCKACPGECCAAECVPAMSEEGQKIEAAAKESVAAIARCLQPKGHPRPEGCAPHELGKILKNLHPLAVDEIRKHPNFAGIQALGREYNEYVNSPILSLHAPESATPAPSPPLPPTAMRTGAPAHSRSGPPAHAHVGAPAVHAY
jgi:hypothetical protein